MATEINDTKTHNTKRKKHGDAALVVVRHVRVVCVCGVWCVVCGLGLVFTYQEGPSTPTATAHHHHRHHRRRRRRTNLKQKHATQIKEATHKSGAVAKNTHIKI